MRQIYKYRLFKVYDLIFRYSVLRRGIMDKPFWMNEFQWQEMLKLLDEKNKLLKEHSKLRPMPRTPEIDQKINKIVKRFHEIQKLVSQIKNQNPLLPHNCVPALQTEKNLLRFWQIYDDLDDIYNLPPLERHQSLKEGIILGGNLIVSNHPQSEELKPIVDMFSNRIVFDVHFADTENELILEVSNGYGEQIFTPINQGKTTTNFKEEFFSKVHNQNPGPAAFRLDSLITEKWSDIVVAIKEKLKI